MQRDNLVEIWVGCCRSTMGEIRGILCMRRHIFVRLCTTTSSEEVHCFKNLVAKEGLPRDDPSALGAGGLGAYFREAEFHVK